VKRAIAMLEAVEDKWQEKLVRLVRAVDERTDMPMDTERLARQQDRIRGSCHRLSGP